MKPPQKVLAFWFFIVILSVMFLQFYQQKHQKTIANFNFNRFMTAVTENKVNPDKLTIHIDTGEFFGEVKPEFEKEFDGRPGLNGRPAVYESVKRGCSSL